MCKNHAKLAQKKIRHLGETNVHNDAEVNAAKRGLNPQEINVYFVTSRVGHVEVLDDVLDVDDDDPGGSGESPKI